MCLHVCTGTEPYKNLKSYTSTMAVRSRSTSIVEDVAVCSDRLQVVFGEHVNASMRDFTDNNGELCKSSIIEGNEPITHPPFVCFSSSFDKVGSARSFYDSIANHGVVITVGDSPHFLEQDPHQNERVKLLGEQFEYYLEVMEDKGDIIGYPTNDIIATLAGDPPHIYRLLTSVSVSIDSSCLSGFMHGPSNGHNWYRPIIEYVSSRYGSRVVPIHIDTVQRTFGQNFSKVCRRD